MSVHVIDLSLYAICRKCPSLSVHIARQTAEMKAELSKLKEHWRKFRHNHPDDALVQQYNRIGKSVSSPVFPNVCLKKSVGA